MNLGQARQSISDITATRNLFLDQFVIYIDFVAPAVRREDILCCLGKLRAIKKQPMWVNELNNCWPFSIRATCGLFLEVMELTDL